MAATPVVSTLPRSGQSERYLQVGELFGDGGRYRIVQIIAIGGMATVYQALDQRLGVVCALKALFLPGLDDETEAEHFKHEAMVLASLHHPGIVAVRDYFVEGDFGILVMDYIDGQDLYDCHKRTGRASDNAENLPLNPISDDQVAMIGLSLAKTLTYLHSHKPVVLYLDMKPHNVMRRSSDGRIILLDFGIARSLRPKKSACYANDFGTPGYAAPEQYEATGILDARTDVYGLGVLMVELATGYNPRADEAALFIPPISSLDSRLAPDLAAILQRCVEQDSSARYQSAEDVAHALEIWLTTPRSLRRKKQPQSVWCFDPGGQAAGAPAANDGTLYFADSEGGLYAVEASIGHVTADVEHPVALSTKAGVPRYSVQLPKSLPGASNAPVAHVASYSGGGAHVTIYDDLLSPTWRTSAETGRLTSTWIGDGTRFAIASSEPNELVCLGRNASKEWQTTWRKRLMTGTIAVSDCGADRGLAILDESGTLSRISVSGEEIWSASLIAHNPNAARLLSCIGDALIISSAGPNSGDSILAIDIATGNRLWTQAGIGRPLHAPICTEESGQLIVPTRESGLVILSAKDGNIISRRTQFERPITGIAHLPVMCDIVALAEYGAGARIVLYDVVKDRIIWSDSLGDVGAIAAPVVHGEIIAVQESFGRMRAWRWEDLR